MRRVGLIGKIAAACHASAFRVLRMPCMVLSTTSGLIFARKRRVSCVLAPAMDFCK
jgi:hypothetical protein